SVTPQTPEVMVPSQNASMSWIDIPADAAASVAASVSRSSTPLSHSSPKRVQPIPMIATWSRMPLLPMVLSLLSSSRGAVRAAPTGQRPGLPEVIVHALGRPHAPERHRHPVPDGQLVRPGVGQLAPEAPPAVEVDDDPDHRRRQRE